jgi:hypothetical protein
LGIVLDKCFRENKNICLITFSKIGAVRETLWKNMVEPDNPQMTVWCTACWILEAAHTQNM